MCSTDCFLFVIAILFPPLPVWVKRGLCSPDSVINIALCVLGYLPGLVHSWYIIAKYPDLFSDEVYGSSAPLDPEAHYHAHRSRRSCHRQPSRQPGLVYGQHHPPPPEAQGYGSFAGTSAPQNPPQTPPESSSSLPQGEPPSYASVIKSDHKVQHD